GCPSLAVPSASGVLTVAWLAARRRRGAIRWPRAGHRRDSAPLAGLRVRARRTRPRRGGSPGGTPRRRPCRRYPAARLRGGDSRWRALRGADQLRLGLDLRGLARLRADRRNGAERVPPG